MRRTAFAVALALGLVIMPVTATRSGLTTFGPGPAAAASPAPTTISGGDPRSAGEGPGLVGTPVVAVGVVVILGVAAALATLAWVRLTGGRPRPG